MASMRDIKRRIKSVNSTLQITKAMNLVSSAKLQKAKRRLEETRPFYDETKRVIASIVNNSTGTTHPLIKEREVKNTLIILITGDRGLCGGYNSNISKLALKFAGTKKKVSIVTVGTKGRDFFKYQPYEIIKSYAGASENPTYESATDLGHTILDLFKSSEVDEVYLAYTGFKTTISHEPKVAKILPVDTSDFSDENKTGARSQMIYDPSEEEVLNFIIPKYINTTIFGAFVEAATCEYSATMTAMDSATENASEMIDKFTLLYNRARQGAITQEITEIVGGANALD